MIPRHHIETAKSGNLPRVLLNMGLNLVSEGRSYHFRDHNSLKLYKKNGKWLYKWWSRDGEAGDCIQYLQRYCGMEFKQAVDILMNSPNDCHQYMTDQFEGKNIEDHWTSNTWQNKSEKLIRFAQSSLFAYAGKEGLDYLIQERGLNPDTVWQHRLGWLPAKNHMPAKILIPCYNTKRQLFRIRFRIEKSCRERYRISRGSNPSLPFPLGISPGKPVILVESELDAILLFQEIGRQIGILALGSAAIKLTPPMVCFLNEKVPAVLVCMDNDNAGRNASIRLKSNLQNAVDCQVPEFYGKDIGDAWKHMNIQSWVESRILKHFLP